MTELTRWNPFNELFKLNPAMEQLFNSAVIPALPGLRSASVPVDIAENDHSYTVQLAVPGINIDDLDIEAKDQELKIRGEWKRPELPEDVTYHIMERTFDRCERSLQFPLPINADAIQATYEYGILTLTLPKSEAARARKIFVQAQPKQLETTAA